MSNISQIENAPVTDKVIVLKATFGKQQGKCLFQPVRKGRVLLGVTEYTEDEKRKVPASHVVTEDTEIWIEDDFRLDLSTKEDAITWEWLKYHEDSIAKSQLDAQHMQDCMFFVKDEDKEIQDSLSKAKLIGIALDIVQNKASSSKRVEICRLMGNRVEAMKPTAVEEFLSSQALREPQKVINAYNDKNYKSKMFLFMAMDKGFITFSNEVYKYGQITLGISEDQVLQYLKSRDNLAIYEHLKAKIFPDYFGENQLEDDAFGAPGKTSNSSTNTDSGIDDNDPFNSPPAGTALTPVITDDISRPDDFGGPANTLTPAPSN